MATQPPRSAPPPPLAPCTHTAVAFDFQRKEESAVAVGDIPEAMAAGRFVWLDVDATDPPEARDILRGFSIVEAVIDAALTAEPATQHARYEQFLHLVVSGCRQRGEHFDLERVDVIIGESFLLTVHRGPVVFLESARRDYRSDFVRFAKSPSFLLYELWDHLLDNYLSVQKCMEERVEALQNELRQDEVDDAVFGRISELGADLLHFRKILLPARAVLTDLSTRKSIFISEATQPFLGNMVGTVEHVLQDLLVDRDILSESLNLYMSLVSHRTNQVMKRLTVVSVVFLPLTFLVGVYGMNFDVLPELRWRYGYALFWALVVVLVVGLVWLLRRARLL
jgi:magnesium transporter